MRSILAGFMAGLAVLPGPVSGAAEAVAEDDLTAAISADMPEWLELYRDLHAHPELGGEERRTASRLAGLIRSHGFAVTEKVGGTGVVAVLQNGPGPVLMIRADMDGLPVTERTGLPFASTVRSHGAEGAETGVMHACGHDTHMAAWLQTAKLLAARRGGWSGTLVMILQPAEENGAGAKAMIDDGLFTRFPTPSHMLAFHNSADLPAGVVGYTPGFALANVDSVDIVVKGTGGHGAFPHAAKDPIILASRIALTLQTLVSREQNPLDPAVVTVGAFNGGTRHNIIPDQAVLQLTVRSFSDGTRRRLLDGIARIARGEAIATDIADDQMPVVTVRDGFMPATWNDPGFSEAMMGLMRARFGADRVVQQPPAMGGEDFSRYGREIKEAKSMIFLVGGVPTEQWQSARTGQVPAPSLHSPHWAPDAQAVIATASEAMTRMALAILEKP